MFEIKHCSTHSDYSHAIQIAKDYRLWLGVDLCFQGFDNELSSFPSMYGPPTGLYLLAWCKGDPVGGVGLRLYEANICEMKRLFVYDNFRKQGIAHTLCKTLIQEAIKLKYEKMRLDTLGRMEAAIGLYANMGFKEIAPYRYNPDPTTRYMELSLERFNEVLAFKRD